MGCNPRLNVPQAKFLSMPNKFRAMVCGFGTGKTWGGCAAIAKHVWEHPKVTSSYFAPSYPQIRDIFFPTIDEVAYDWGLSVRVKTSDKEVDYYSGSKYRGTTICRSMDNPASIIGFKSGYSLVDEFDTLTTEKALHAYRKILARMRYKIAGLRNGVDFVTTPEGFRATHKIFVHNLIDKPEKAKNYGILHASTYENEANLPDDYIPSLVEAYDANLIKAYLNGHFVNLTSGTVYYAFDESRCSSTEKVSPGDHLYIGMDFNVSKMAATVYVRKGLVWHAVAEEVNRYDTPDMCRALIARFPGHRMTVYPDASGKKRSTTGASTSDIKIIRDHGFIVRARESNPLVRDRINAVNAALTKGLLRVNPITAPETKRCLEQQAYDKRGEPDKQSGTDHQNDATTYPIAYEMPIIRVDVAGVPVRFG